MRIRVHLEYDGAAYGGWQRQKNANSVQSEVEKALLKLTGKPVTVHGAGRTDAGVHAQCMVMHFDVEGVNIEPQNFAGALNSKMPFDIRALCSFRERDDFHSRFDATGKQYIYTILNRREPTALYRNRAWHVFLPLDVDKMKQGAAHLLGAHDFSAFMGARSFVETTVRTIYSIDIMREGELIRLLFKGDGFLRKQVRIMAGTLVNVGLGRHEPEWIGRVVESRDRLEAGMTAPAHGLCLAAVYYNGEEKL